MRPDYAPRVTLSCLACSSISHHFFLCLRPLPLLLQDKNPDPAAVSSYQQVTEAYEVVGDASARAAYDDMLANPEAAFRHRMKYYQHQYRHAKQIDAWKILLLTLLLVSLAHYYYWSYRHKKVRAMIASAPQVVIRMRAKCKADLIEEKIKAGDKKVSRRMGEE